MLSQIPFIEVLECFRAQRFDQELLKKYITTANNILRRHEEVLHIMGPLEVQSFGDDEEFSEDLVRDCEHTQQDD